MICFGCYITFPPNIEINISGKFCIQLFGLKIGNCPPDQDKSGTDHTGKDDPPHSTGSDPTQSETKTESCTSTITRTYESVFCTVTGTAKDNTAPCSTQAYSVVTGCTVEASQVTTTTTATAEPDYYYCRPGSCGQGSCAQKEASAPDSTVAGDITKRGSAEEGDWKDPGDYTSHAAFVSEGVYEKSDEFSVKELVPLPTDTDEEIDMTTSTVVRFKDKVVSLAVQGLYGCTSVLVVSERGAWACHIWEINFRLSLSAFEENALEFIRTGLPPHNSQYREHQYGLKDLRGRPGHPQDMGVIFGNDDKDVPNTRVYIMAPRSRVWVQNKKDATGAIVALVNMAGVPMSDVSMKNIIPILSPFCSGVVVGYRLCQSETETGASKGLWAIHFSIAYWLIMILSFFRLRLITQIQMRA